MGRLRSSRILMSINSLIDSFANVETRLMLIDASLGVSTPVNYKAS